MWHKFTGYFSDRSPQPELKPSYKNAPTPSPEFPKSQGKRDIPAGFYTPKEAKSARNPYDVLTPVTHSIIKKIPTR